MKKYQISLIKAIQDNILNHKLSDASNNNRECPGCTKALHKTGKHQSWFHDVLTDHQLKKANLQDIRKDKALLQIRH